MPLNLVARYASGATLSSPSVLMAFRCTSSILLRALSLYTADLPAPFRKDKSNFLTDNTNAL